MDPHKHAQGIISIQLAVKYNGQDCQTLIVDPRRQEGFSWTGGFFRPTGSLYETIDELVKFETGAKSRLDTLRLKRIIYSRSAVNKRWLANHTFALEAEPIENWSTPRNPDFKVALFETASFDNFPNAPPKKVLDYHGSTNSRFMWAINDGGYIGKLAACTEK